MYFYFGCSGMDIFQDQYEFQPTTQIFPIQEVGKVYNPFVVNLVNEDRASLNGKWKSF